MNTTVVSVVLSVYNAEKYLQEAIQSIINQTYKDFEFIIINDGSTDNSMQIIKGFADDRIVLIDRENKGFPYSLNEGIKLAKGMFIVRMDADDVCQPDRIELQLQFLQQNPEYVAIGSNATEIDENGNEIYTSNLIQNGDRIDIEMKKRLENGMPLNPFYHSSTMFKKEAWENIGGYPLIRGEDVIFFNRMKEQGKFINLPQPLLKYRVVPTAYSLRQIPEIDRFRGILVKAIKYQEITTEDKKFLDYLKNLKVNPKLRFCNHYLYLAKKYLINNRRPLLSLKNCFKALVLNPFRLTPYLYIVMNLIPVNYLKLKELKAKN